jgi:Lon protease-like protein
MDAIPLFPLNTVLFPGAPLDLYVFEDRYKRLIRDCRSHDGTFGVSLIREGSEAFGSANNRISSVASSISH